MSQSPISRRQLLKVLAAAAGTAVLSSVPNKWKTPVVDVGMLPAHAQTLSGTGSLTGTIGGLVAPVSGNSPKIVGPVDFTVGLQGFPSFTVNATGSYPTWSYTISNIPAGTYTVVLTDVGYCGGAYTQTVTGVVIHVGTPTTHNFTVGGC